MSTRTVQSFDRAQDGALPIPVSADRDNHLLQWKLTNTTGNATISVRVEIDSLVTDETADAQGTWHVPGPVPDAFAIVCANFGEGDSVIAKLVEW